jgi:hypothetical protein
MLGLARTASVDDVVLASAVALGRPRDPIRAILIDAEPRTDRDLVRLSDDLAGLEAAVHAATVPGESSPTNGAPPS